jgi:hypothetical protein
MSIMFCLERYAHADRRGWRGFVHMTAINSAYRVENKENVEGYTDRIFKFGVGKGELA